MINAVIVEDEKKSRELLNNLIKKNCPDIQIVALADSVEAGVEAIRKFSPALIFLDVEMQDGSGFDLLNKLQDQKFDVIFTTASDKHAINAIKYSAIDYLLKPIDVEELITATKKILEKTSNVTNTDHLKILLQHLKQDKTSLSKIALPVGNAFEVVNVKDVVRCEAEGSYTNFVLNGGKKLLVTNSLKYFEDILPEEIFIRVHHHHLVNTNHVLKYFKADGGYVLMDDGAKIEISRRKREDFLQKIGKV